MNAEPPKECDIIMKGGITSGIVYPEAILRLSERYRFRSIGGTSAGAIAAAITAASEYNRAGGGFATIASIPAEMREHLPTLFQPTPEVRTVFALLTIGFLEKRWVRAIGCVLAKYWPFLSAGISTGAMFAIPAYIWAGTFAAVLLLLLGALAGIALVVTALASNTVRDLRDLDFGLCPGPTQRCNDRPGLSNWLADTIEFAAGRMGAEGSRPKRPLTFGDLWRGGVNGQGTKDAPAIDLRMMTTNLSLRRPNTLPTLDGNHFFKEEEFRRLFPNWIVDYLVDASSPDEQHAAYLKFPDAADLPVVVAARMSLSFPLLISAVPLYRKEFPFADSDGNVPFARMLFSDGGLSSNFPVHFFDAFLPHRPTFGIALEAYDDRVVDRRVRLPMLASRGIWLEGDRIETLPDFLMALVNAAKDWQDRLQSTLPGYRERIVSVYLTDKEGGLNLNMPADRIDALTNLGRRAGELFVGMPSTPDDQDTFDFDDHRWRRYLVAFARIEQTLETASLAWGDEADPSSFAAFIANYMSHGEGSYKSSPINWRKEVFNRLNGLLATAASWKGHQLRSRPNAIPKPDTDMRITPKTH